MTDHSDLIAELRDLLTDWNGADLPDSELPRVDILCGTIRRAASALSSQSLSLSEALERCAGWAASFAKKCGEHQEALREIERLKKLSDRYGVALMMIRAGGSDPARFAGNILDDRQPVNVELDEEDFDENHR